MSDQPGGGAVGAGIEYVTCGSFSGTNEAILPLLERAFPEQPSHRFDVATWLRSDRRLLTGGVAHVLAESGPMALAGRTRFRQGLYRSAYLDRRVGAEMRSRTAGRRRLFSFQTQSMFNAAVPGLPHFVYTDHTALANSYYPGFDRRRFPPSWIEREAEIYRDARLTFTMGGHVARSLVEHYGIEPERVSCVGAGGNVEIGAAAPRPGPRDRKRILFVGREWRRKGGPELIAALPLVRERHPEATLVVAGCTPRVGTEGVEVLGNVPAARVGELLAEASVFCMPTRAEPFGLAFVEALSQGVPVVATNLGALPEIVQDGETGLLVAPDDIAGLARAISALLDDPERARRFGALGRERTLTRYTWPRVVDSIAAQIREQIGAADARS